MLSTLVCIISGEKTPFLIKINEDQLVGKLKDAMKEEQQLLWLTRQFMLYKLNARMSDKDYSTVIKDISQNSFDLKEKEPLYLLHTLANIFSDTVHLKDMVHILVVPPQCKSIDP